jgi:hypothetical protein
LLSPAWDIWHHGRPRSRPPQLPMTDELDDQNTRSAQERYYYTARSGSQLKCQMSRQYLRSIRNSNKPYSKSPMELCAGLAQNGIEGEIQNLNPGMTNETAHHQPEAPLYPNTSNVLPVAWNEHRQVRDFREQDPTATSHTAQPHPTCSIKHSHITSPLPIYATDATFLPDLRDERRENSDEPSTPFPASTKLGYDFRGHYSDRLALRAGNW